ncbi:MAG: hypothetical protein JWR90_1521 [Marmoricola sp.]|jgi:hypothetical protein|nr:hypothetical protein [Marmoricola sp.]
MDQVSADDTARADLGSRRRRMRASARSLHPGPATRPDGFQTPEWLDRSFVLPLTEPEATDVPTQPVPHHDDDEERPPTGAAPESGAEPAPAFVRPPSKEIDFARVIRRSDLSRTAIRAAIVSAGAAGLVLILFLLTGSPVVLGMAIAFGIVSLGALGARVRLATAPIPHRDA